MKLDAPLKRDALLAVCSLVPPPRAGACAWCDAELPPRRRTWCSDRCNDAFWANHWWSVARTTAKRRDRYCCRRCGARGPKRPTRAAHRTRAAYLKAMRAYRDQKKVARLEVNHVDPALGRHGELSCVHHLANLETLCLRCHKKHTAALRPGKRAVQLDAGDVPGVGLAIGLPKACAPPRSAMRGVSRG